MRSALQAITRTEQTHPSMTMPLSAALAAPFAVLGVRTQHGYVTEVEYLPRDHDEIAPRDRVAAKTVRQLERYLAEQSRHEPALETVEPVWSS